jgi:hypothetical protein
MVGSEMTNSGGGALRPSTTADGGTPGERLAPNSGELIGAVPIAKVSRKKWDLVRAGIFIRRYFLLLHVAVNGSNYVGAGGRNRRQQRLLKGARAKLRGSKFYESDRRRNCNYKLRQFM